MSKTDPQIKSNDCGISVVKTIYNIFGNDISRNYIEKKLPIEEKGTRLSDMKDFFNQNGYIGNFKLLDINYMVGNKEFLQNLFPFVLPINHKYGLHYVVVNGQKGNKLKIYDPNKGAEYYLSLQELKKKSHFIQTSWDLAETEEKILAICSAELANYKIDIHQVLQEHDYATLFNKLTYFTYFKENFGFKNEVGEKDFLVDLLKNQEISEVPTHFKSLKLNKDKVTISAPLILTVKQKAVKDLAEIPTEEHTNMYVQLFKKLGSNRKLWYIYIFAALFSATATQFTVFINQILIDNILPSYNLSVLLLFAIGLLIYKVFNLSTSIYKSFVGIHLSQILDRYFLNSFDEKINTFSLPYIHSYKKGDLIERVSDSLKLKSFFLSFFTNVIIDVFVSIYSLGILFYLNWRLTILVVVSMVLFFVLYKVLTPRIKQNERLRYIRKADFLSKIIEKIEGIQVIKSFRIEAYHSNKIIVGFREYLKIQLRNGYLSILNRISVAFIIIISSTLIMYFLTKDAILTQDITLGQIITFIALSGTIFSSLRGILDETLTLQENEVILKRYMDFEEEELPENNNDGISNFQIENLEIQNLSFGYLPNDFVLKDISLKIKKGEKIKIEGQNGSGKSTLSKILTTLYYPEDGDILINDINKKFYSTEEIKSKILLVTNEDILFNDSIRENICLGKNISTEEVLEMAKNVEFYEFINSKEEGLDFIINENGKNLSTGQRKKILLMRALFSEAEILILDEVLSGMDADTRNKVEFLIDKTIAKTFIIISHEPIHNISFTYKYKIENGELFPL